MFACNNLYVFLAPKKGSLAAMLTRRTIRVPFRFGRATRVSICNFSSYPQLFTFYHLTSRVTSFLSQNFERVLDFSRARCFARGCDFFNSDCPPEFSTSPRKPSLWILISRSQYIDKMRTYKEPVGRGSLPPRITRPRGCRSPSRFPGASSLVCRVRIRRGRRTLRRIAVLGGVSRGGQQRGGYQHAARAEGVAVEVLLLVHSSYVAAQIVATRAPVSAMRAQMRLLARVHAPMLYQL